MPDASKWDGLPRIVHVLCIGTAEAAEASDLISRVAQQIDRRVVQDLRVCDTELGPIRVDLPFDGCAAIVIVRPAALHSRPFVKAVRNLLTAMRERDDLRVYVVLNAVDDTTDDLIAELMEAVQFVPKPMLAEVEAPLAEFLDNLRASQDCQRWRAIRYRPLVLVGRVAALAQVAGVAGTAVFFGILRLRVQGLIADATMYQQLLGICAGATNAAATMLPVFYLSRGFSAPSLAMARDPSLKRWVPLGLFASIGALILASEAGVDTRWLVLGMAIGSCLDGIRRAGRQAERVGHGLATLESAASTRLEMPRSRAFVLGNPFTCALWPSFGRAVVISYGQSSKWGSSVAEQLHAALDASGAQPFLDLRNIPIGASWRRELQHEIGRASTLICLVDERSAERPWVATELASAMRAQVRCGAPHVVCLVHPDLRGGSGIPIFQEILAAEQDPSALLRPPRIIRFQPGCIEVIASGLTPERQRQAAILPPKPAMMLEGLLVPMTAIGALAGPLGVLAWPAWGYEMWTNNRLLSTAGEAFGTSVFLFVAFWAGFGARLAVVSRFIVQHEKPLPLSMTHWFSTFGFVALTMAWLPAFTPLIKLWAAVVAVFGMWRAGQFLAVSSLSKPILNRELT